MTLQIELFMCRQDNFGVLAHDPASGATVLVDAPEEAPILAAIERTGWRPAHLLVTHHHGDHVAAIEPLKERFGLTVSGPEADRHRIPGMDTGLKDGDRLQLLGETVEVIATPGHTSGHIVYHFRDSGILFAADTLFALGCGRVIEGTMDEMHASLERLKALPPATTIHCGHEYTLANAAFALSVDPDNAELRRRAEEAARLRAAGRPTLPTTLAAELAANPFLRPHDPAIRARLGMNGASDAEVFAELRRRKDVFRG